jgi:hypothetical protein
MPDTAIATSDLLNREQAAAYIARRVGITMTASALAYRASAGTGPRYSMFGGARGGWGRIAVYRVSDLDDWILSQLHDPPPRALHASAASSS